MENTTRQEPIGKEHILKTCEDILKALYEIINRVNQGNQDSDDLLRTMLCRVGELELCLDYNFMIYYNHQNVILKPNRLCTCYDRTGGEDF